jgi:arylsulfatase A-like enzyme
MSDEKKHVQSPAASRRELLLGGAVLSAAAAGPAAGKPVAATRPNIVFMLVDNLGFGDLSCYTGGAIRGVTTPRIDRFAAEGVRLTNFMVEPACTPSRSAFMTGRMPIRSGTSAVVNDGAPDGLTPWEYTLAELLSDSGYATALYGKWHLGSVEGRFPTDQGFDEWYGIPRSTDETLEALQPGFDAGVYTPEPVLEGRKGEPSRKVRDYDYAFRPYIDREVTDRAVDYIRRHAHGQKPFFLYVPFTLPHDPPLAHPEFSRPGRSQYQNVLAEIDANAGRVLDAIEAAGVRQDTIVVFASDNGPQTLYGRGIDYGAQADPGPFRGEFPSGWEGAIRTAAIVRWPGRTAPGRVTNEIVSILDFYRTFARAAGAEDRVPKDRPIDSVDQGDFLFGAAPSRREHVMVFHGDELLAVKWRNFKLHWAVREPARGEVVTPGQGVVNGYRRRVNNPWLFDVENDPKELWNINTANVWVLRPITRIVSEYKKSVSQFPNIRPGAPGPA